MLHSFLLIVLEKSLVLLESSAPVGSSANIIEGNVINALAADVRSCLVTRQFRRVFITNIQYI